MSFDQNFFSSVLINSNLTALASTTSLSNPNEINRELYSTFVTELGTTNDRLSRLRLGTDYSTPDRALHWLLRALDKIFCIELNLEAKLFNNEPLAKEFITAFTQTRNKLMDIVKDRWKAASHTPNLHTLEEIIITKSRTDVVAGSGMTEYPDSTPKWREFLQTLHQPAELVEQVTTS